MPGAKGAKGRVKRGAAPAWADEFTELCLPPPKPKPRRPKAKKRFHRAFRVLIALGLIPTKSRQCDPLGLRLNRMHVMDSDCEKTGGCLAESAPDLIKSSPGDESSHDPLRDAKTATDEASAIVPVNGNHSPADDQKEEDEKVGELTEEETKGEDKSPQGCVEVTQESEKEEVESKEEVEEEKTMEVDESASKESPLTPKEAPVNTVVESEDTLKVKTEVSLKAEKKEGVEEKEDAVPANEEDDRHSITSSHQSQCDVESRKRRSSKEVEAYISSGSESDSGRKKIKIELEAEAIQPLDLHRDQSMLQIHSNALEEGREKVIQDFVNECCRTEEEMNNAAEKIRKELVSLEELARVKESEWNTILRVRKLKEEMLERINRKKRLNLLDDNVLDRLSDSHNAMKNAASNQLMMVPIVSSSPSNLSGRNISSWKYDNPSSKPHQRQILPKPPYNAALDPSSIVREGRNGPIKDVQSIIADFKSTTRNEAPKRFRRGRQEAQQNRMSNNPALISMANMALGSGASVRTLDAYSPHMQDNSRSPSGDPSRVSDGPGGVGFKDVLVQFAKMSQAPGKGGHVPPPPYPEVTLHPVGGGHQSPPPTTTSSLLHGILTKPTTAPPQRPANFSPTLARLLVAPERPIRHPAPPPPPPPYSASRTPQPSNHVSLTDILTSSKKSRNEITITPVSGHPNVKAKEDVVLLERYLKSTTRSKALTSIPENLLFKALDDDDETGSGDRLVIDEGADGEEVPQCQGCRQKSAQFVCAGCGNQWYCSRECQVAAWEEHSEMCSE